MDAAYKYSTPEFLIKIRIVFVPLIIAFCLILLASAKIEDPLENYSIIFQDTGNYTVKDIFKTVEKQTDLVFSYNPQLINLQQVINITFDTSSLSVLIKNITNQLSTSWRVIDKHIILFQSDKIIKNNPETNNQDTLNILVIRGKVVDKSNGQSIPYANISVVDKSIGTVANQDGEFIIKLPSELLYDKLAFNCIGFKPTIIDVAQMFNLSKSEISLEPKYVSIPEVIIRKTEPVRLLINAINKIPENYNNNSVILTGFYRETIKKNNQYVMICEAAINTYKSGYNLGNSNDQIKIIKSRKDDRISKSDSLLLKLKAGLNTAIALDIIKDRPDFLDPESFKFYTYTMEDIVSQNNKDLYVIDFKQRDFVQEVLYEGKIYIDIKSLAIVSCEFKINEDKISKAADYFILKKPVNLKIRPVVAQYQVAYTEINNLYYLSFVKANTGFFIRKKGQFSGSNYYTNIEMVTTDVDSINVKRFKLNEIARTNVIFTEQANPDYSYWEDYNYIEPTEPLEEALRKHYTEAK